MHLNKYNNNVSTKLDVRFYCSANGSEPVRDWLNTEVSVRARKAIGADIKTVQMGWPLGMPLVRKMQANLWEVRCDIPEGTARILFTMNNAEIVLLHGFMKKSQSTPKNALEIAVNRLKEVRNE